MSATQRIAEILESKGIGAYKLELDLGFSNGRIRKMIERDGKCPDDVLEKIAEYLGVTPEYLRKGDTVAVQVSTGHLTTNTQNVGDAAALAIAQERIKALETQVEQLQARIADKDEIIALLKGQKS